MYCIVGDAGAVAESAAGGEWGRALCIAGEARPFQENILIFAAKRLTNAAGRDILLLNI